MSWSGDVISSPLCLILTPTLPAPTFATKGPEDSDAID